LIRVEIYIAAKVTGYMRASGTQGKHVYTIKLEERDKEEDG
jgi:hypothetical protein